MEPEKNTHKLFPLCILLILVFPGNAWGVQGHGAPEGLYVHQLAHIFYVAALCYLFWDVRRSVFQSRGWRFLQVFCILMILWNLTAFAGHFLAGFVSSSDFTTDSGYLSTHFQGPFTAIKLWYYFTKLDHLFSVPSFFFLFLSMRAIYRSSCEDKKI